jgi:SAM-dependent methyltransferase
MSTVPADPNSALPGYAAALSAYHRAFAAELRQMVGTLPLGGGNRVLDLACGDGAYSGWLAERVGARGLVVAVDADDAFLDAARRQPGNRRVAFLAADVRRLPLPDGSFDLVWCAQSLYSLPDPVKALAAMRRIVRPGGVVAVLENDTLHQVLLPWPVELELAIRRAELVGFVEESDHPRKFYIGRRLGRLFRHAGLVHERTSTWASNRLAPLGEDERLFLTEYLRDLRARVTPHLAPDVADAFARLADPGSPEFLLDDPDLCVTSLDHVAVGRRPVAH